MADALQRVLHMKRGLLTCHGRHCRHEIVGIVTEVGKDAEGHFKVGDRAGVGCMVRACRDCELCHIGDDQYCTRCVFTYNGKDWGENDAVTQGGYSTRIVLDHRCAPNITLTVFRSLCSGHSCQ